MFTTLVSTACRTPEIVVHDREQLSTIRTVVLLPVEVNTLEFNPYMTGNLMTLAGFELVRAGFEVIHGNTDISGGHSDSALTNRTDAFLKLSLMHSKNYKNIKEEDTMTILVELTGRSNHRVCSVMYSETSGRDLMRTDTLASMLRNLFSLFKPATAR